MLAANEMQLINPGDDPSIWVFHNILGDDGVCGLGFARAGQAATTACLLVSRTLHTQKILHELSRKGLLYERSSALLAATALRPGDIAIDIGAHVGFFSTIYRLATGPEGMVFAFEPLPETFRRLQNNLAFNEFANVSAIPLALSDHCGEEIFHINPDNEGESSLIGTKNSTACRVKVSTLDTCFAEGFRQRPRLMKLDVEGVELRVLQGGQKFFADWAPDVVFCEINCGALAAGGASELALRNFFTERSYRCAVVNNGIRDGLAIGSGQFYRYLKPNENSARANYDYVYNLMFVREDAGLFPLAML